MLGRSKPIRYSGDFVTAGFVHIFYCNSAGLSNVVRYNVVFVIAGFVIEGCYCNVIEDFNRKFTRRERSTLWLGR